MQRNRTELRRPKNARRAERLEINPEFATRFAVLGLDSPGSFLDLPGEVVSGHPDRHVMRVELSDFPSAFYLKRQHSVRRRERFRNWRAGFGYVSRSEREAEVLKRLAAAGLPCPRWAAVGEDTRGRAFLLVEEVPGAINLRRCLSDNTLSQRDRRRLATRLGRLLAELHANGFTTPDYTAKHLLISGDTAGITPIDWQTTRRVRLVSMKARTRALAALHASVPDDLATPRDRLRVLRAALASARSTGLLRERFANIARRVAREALRLAKRRSIRDQRQELVETQRLVWLADEAVCAVPDVAAIWPSPAVGRPFYDAEPGEVAIRLPDSRKAHLIRGRSFAPLGRLSAALRGRSWRSPGVRLGRVLFHLERYGIAAPRLFAFGQRHIGSASAEWFVLHSPPAARIEEPSRDISEQLGRLLRQLHDAGSRPTGDPLSVFGTSPHACVREVRAIRLVKRVSNRDRASDLRWLVASIPTAMKPAVEAGYAVPDSSKLSRAKPRTPAGMSR